MRSSVFLLLLASLPALVACDFKRNREEADEPEQQVFPFSPKEQEMNRMCGFDKLLNDPKTPAMAKELFTDCYDFGNDDPLVLFDKLTGDPSKRLFYFKVITKISDGYYSEALGRKTAEYIQQHTKDFAAYFDYEECITGTDLQTWADNVTLYLKKTGPETGGEKFAVDFNQKLFDQCKGCSEGQEITISHFAALLEENWQDYLAEE